MVNKDIELLKEGINQGFEDFKVEIVEELQKEMVSVVEEVNAGTEANEVLWEDCKHIGCIPIPWVKYSLTLDKVLLTKGLLSTTYDETRLFRVLDVTLTRTLSQKIFGIGTIIVKTSEETLVLQGVRDSLKVKDLISDTANKNRKANRSYREVGVNNDSDNYDGYDGPDDLF